MFRILFLFWLSFHPVHVTITSLDYVTADKELKGFVRLYLDDLLLDCGCGSLKEKLIAGEKLSFEELEKYLNDKLIITVNNKTITGEINDIDVNNDEVDVGIQYSSRTKPEIIVVKSLIMTGLYKDQSNMVIVKVDDFEKGVKLTPDVTEQTFKVN